MGALVIKFYLDKKIQAKREQGDFGEQITPSLSLSQQEIKIGKTKKPDKDNYRSLPVKAKMAALIETNENKSKD